MAVNQASRKSYIKGISNLITVLKTIAAYNRTNEMYVIGELTVNKYNPLITDFRLKSAYNTDKTKKLNIPESVPRICYEFSKELQSEEFKVYKFSSNPVEFTYQEQLMSEVKKETINGKYGPYNTYSFEDDYTEELEHLGNIKI